MVLSDVVPKFYVREYYGGLGSRVTANSLSNSGSKRRGVREVSRTSQQSVFSQRLQVLKWYLPTLLRGERVEAPGSSCCCLGPDEGLLHRPCFLSFFCSLVGMNTFVLLLFPVMWQNTEACQLGGFWTTG